MLNDTLKMEGYVHLVVRGPDGQIKHEQEGKNLIVTAGKAFVAGALITIPAIQMTHVACGTGTTAASVGQTALVTETARVAATTSNPTSVTALFSANFPAGTGTGTIEEIGIFSASSSGTMFSRYVTGTVTKGVSDSVTISWTITVS